MTWTKKLLLFMYIFLIIAHLISFVFYEESLTSFTLGSTAGLMLLIALIIKEKKK